ncbi:MAG TPA: hypothetical protein VFE46_06305 [Pirellulales bacterium]|jgi:hypothetical protein|nr:hypothetical protein [Pirellulales bacterium]
MWCQHCQQDVPAIATGDAARCAQCGQFLKRTCQSMPEESDLAEVTVWEAGLADDPSNEIVMATPATAQSAGVRRPAFEDDWELTEQIRSLQHRLNLPVVPSGTKQQLTAQSDGLATQTATPARHYTPIAAGQGTATARSIVAWGLMSLGLMCFVCGGVLLAWSFLGHRNDLWNLGMPLTLAGQFGLLLGLVFQLDHLWHANRRTTETLENVDRQLHEINHNATMLRTSHGTPGQSFYAHLAEGAHPHLLLTDLKGQLDLLANKLSQQR